MSNLETMPFLDSIQRLYYMINTSRKPSLIMDDLVRYARRKKLEQIMNKLTEEKISSYMDEENGVITIESLQIGYIKEIDRLNNEITVFTERKELEDALYNELAREEAEEPTVEYNDDGLMLGAKFYLAIVEAKNIQTKKNPNCVISGVITCGSIQLATETVLLNDGMAVWLDERFSLPIFNGNEHINISLYEEENDGTEKKFIAASEVSLETLKDFRIHKRTYPLFDEQGEFCGELVLKLLYIFDQPKYDAEKIKRKREAYQTTSARSECLLKLLSDKLYNLKNAQGDELFEEMFGREVELPASLLSKSNENEAPEPPEGEIDYLSETPSIYDEENMINLFINNFDEEKIFEKCFEREHRNESHSQNTQDLLDDVDERMREIPVSDNESKKEKAVAPKKNIGKPPTTGIQKKMADDLEISGFQNEFNSNGLSFSEIDSTRNFFLDGSKGINKTPGQNHQLNTQNLPPSERSNQLSGKAEDSVGESRFKPSARSEGQNLKSAKPTNPKNTTNGGVPLKNSDVDKKEKFHDIILFRGLTAILKSKK